MFKNNELKYLGKFYLSTLILSSFAVISPYFVIYFKDIGFSFFQISLLSIITSFSIMLFEIPTGVIADKISRKISVLLGSLIIGIFLILIGLVNNFYIILLFWFIIGFSLTLISGAASAWVVDNLKKKKEQRLIKEYYFKLNIISSIGILLSPILASLIIKFFSMKVLWFFYGFGFIISFLILFLIPEYYKPKNKIKSSSFKLKEFITLKKTISKEIILIFLVFIFFTLTLSAEIGWQPYLVELGLDVAYLGVIYFFLGFFNILLSLILSYKIKQDNQFRILIILLFFYLFLFLLLFFLHINNYILATILFLLIVTLNNNIKIILNAKYQELIPSRSRATLTSIKNMFVVFISSIFVLLAGKLLDNFSFKLVFSSFGIFIIFIIFILYNLKDIFINRKKEKFINNSNKYK